MSDLKMKRVVKTKKCPSPTKTKTIKYNYSENLIVGSIIKIMINETEVFTNIKILYIRQIITWLNKHGFRVTRIFFRKTYC